jgi:hypothetical protein
MTRLLHPQNVNASSGIIFLFCLMWVVIGFSFLFLFLSKNKDFRSVVSTFRRLPLLAKIITLIVVSVVVGFGGSKPGGAKPFNFNTWFPANTTGSDPSLSDAQKAAGCPLCGQWTVGSG